MVLRFFDGRSLFRKWLERRVPADILGISHKREAHLLAAFKARRKNTAKYASNLLFDIAAIGVADPVNAGPYDPIARFVELILGKSALFVSYSKL